MAILKIKTYPDSVLRSFAKPVNGVDRDVRKLIDDMAETMYEAPGIGLAANQVGELKRVIVIDIQREGESTGLIALVNPEIVERKGSIAIEEGCLSVPDYYSEVKRAEEVRVRGLDLNGKQIEIDAKGLLAVVFQHEIDHLNGKLFIDRLNPIKREIFKRNWKKKKKKKG
ncbi:MAG: peptide deformylase [Deltaproteobacteria bacterium]|nr:MAG: peptide deformylase [Deltaproteobacteria bacterium]